MADKNRLEALLDLLGKSGFTVDDALDLGEEHEVADLCAAAILGLNAGEVTPEAKMVEHLMDLIQNVHSERLRTVCIGTIWREDIDWLNLRSPQGIDARLRLLAQVTGDKPEALTPVFWRAVADRGPRYLMVAFDAVRDIHEHEAARLLVRICRAALTEQVEIEIRSTVDTFLAKRDATVRSAFLDAVRAMPQREKRSLMTHLDMSLMAELDESAIEARGKSFFYDEDAERRKREDKGKDIFSEVARRLSKGEKPQ